MTYVPEREELFECRITQRGKRERSQKLQNRIIKEEIFTPAYNENGIDWANDTEEQI